MKRTYPGISHHPKTAARSGISEQTGASGVSADVLCSRINRPKYPVQLLRLNSASHCLHRGEFRRNQIFIMSEIFLICDQALGYGFCDSTPSVGCYIGLRNLLVPFSILFIYSVEYEATKIRPSRCPTNTCSIRTTRIQNSRLQP